ncbi:MAG: serine/threonine-protein kinase [Kofleriaceae bacterium]
MNVVKPACANDLIGQMIAGRFEIRGKLGEGGMGAVYRAVQRSVNREVALKLMTARYSRDAEAIARFQREAQLACQLSHPNIVTVFDHGQSETGQLFIAMELLRGRTLLDAVRREGAFTIDRIVEIGQQASDGLEAAHAMAIVHRDLKLDNVMLVDQPSGRELVKLLDFGLATSEDALNVTAIGMVVGTPRYVAPEHTTTGRAEAASDVYALGVILGELALGGPLWEGDDLAELLRIKLHPGSVIARLPPALRRSVGAMLDPAPHQRPTAAEARSALQQARIALTASTSLGLWVPPRRGAAEPQRPAAVAPALRAVSKRPARRLPLALAAIAVAVFALSVVAHRIVGGAPVRAGPSIANSAARASDELPAVKPAPIASAAPIAPPSSPAAGPGRAQLRIESLPRGAQILVDGVDQGRGTAVLMTAIRDRHHVECRLRGHRSRTMTVTISDPQTVVTCALEALGTRRPAAPPVTRPDRDDTDLTRPGD